MIFSHLNHPHFLERQIAGLHYLYRLEREQQLYRQTSQPSLAQAVMKQNNYKMTNFLIKLHGNFFSVKFFLDNSIIEGGEIEGWMSPLETPGNADQLRT